MEKCSHFGTSRKRIGTLRLSQLPGLLLALAMLCGCEQTPESNTVAATATDHRPDSRGIAEPVHLMAQLGHSGGMTSVAYSPDGRLVLTGGQQDHSALLWDVATGRELRRFEGHAAAVYAVAFAPDGRTVLTGGGDSIARLWDVATGRELRRFEGHAVAIDAVDFAPDGRSVLTGSSDNTARLWDVETGRELRRFEGHSDLNAHVWGVEAVAFAPDGRTVVTGSLDEIARLWDVATGKELRRFEGHSSLINAVVFSPDGHTLVTGSPDSTARLWDVATGREQRRLQGHAAQPYEVAFAPDGRSVLTGVDDGTAWLWDIATGRERRHFEVDREGSMPAMAFMPGGRAVLTITSDGTAGLWDVATRRGQARTFKGYPTDVDSVAFSSDGRSVLTAGGEAALLWDLATGKALRQFKADWGDVLAVAFSPDGRLVLTGSEALDNPELTFDVAPAKLWDAATGRELRRFAGDSGDVFAVAFSPDGHSALTGSLDRTARLWDVATGQELQRFEGHSGYVNAVVFSPDGRSVLTAGGADKTVRLWDGATGKELRRFEGHSGFVDAVAFSPDGRTVLTGSGDGTTRLWNAATGEELAQLISFRDGSWAVVDRDGRFDASNGGDVEGLHWVVGLEPIALSQLKERYYEPGLLAKKLGFNPEPLQDVAAFADPKLYPEVQVASLDPSHPVLGITLSNRGGGIGRVVVAINGKEAQSDARGPTPDPDVASLKLKVPLAGHPYLLPGQNNTIDVRAYNAEGYLSSRGVVVDFQSPGAAPTEPPTLWALVAGISDYAGDPLDLRYAAKDAEDMARALTLGARRLFGAERVRLFLLTTDKVEGVREPTKAEFRKVYQQMEAAKPQDILVVYLAGHGVAFQDNYYYLTRDARSAELTDPEVRQQAAVSTEELIRWITKTPALKQVMILDTCQAGALEAKLIEKRDIASGQIRALERLKDRTGFHVLMGSAADAASYEATRFQQGLLTYALLQGMKGPALRDGDFVDVSRLFQHAADAVPELAGQVGGIQRPRIAAPRATSFDIGQLTREDRTILPLAQSKPLLLQPMFLNREEGFDNLELTAKVRKLLREASYAGARGQGVMPDAVYVDAEELPGAIRPSGAYQVHGQKLTVTVVLVRDQRKLKQIRVEGSTQELDALTGRIVTEIDRAVAAAK